MIQGPVLTPLRRFPAPNGEVRHVLKRGDAGFHGFGEAYLSCIEQDAVRGWKRHTRQTSNLVVVCGEVRFMLRDEHGNVAGCHLSPDRDAAHARLTVPPGLWLAFGGVAQGVSVTLNLADLEHDPAEAENRPLSAFGWTWHAMPGVPDL